MTERTRVLVADDHPVFREGLARAIRERAELGLVAEADDGRAALAAIRDVEPDVAVLDVKMPELDGTQVIEAFVRGGARMRVVLLSASARLEVAARLRLRRDRRGARP